MAQPEQPAPQDDLPAFLSFIIVLMTSATTAAITSTTNIVPQFAANHSFMKITFFYPVRSCSVRVNTASRSLFSVI